MSKLLVSTVCAILALPVTALADNDRPAPHHQQSGWHAPPPNHGSEHHYDHDDHYRDHNGGSRHYGYSPAHYYASPVRYYGPPVRYYRPPVRYYGPAPQYYYGGHHHDHDNDDALWAIGGLVLGAVIGHAVEHSSSTAATTSTTQHTSTCKDTVAYDSDGNPYVKRDCT